jgi:hypothetical protein
LEVRYYVDPDTGEPHIYGHGVTESNVEEVKEQKFPPGWDEKRVKELIAHYENQDEDEEFADIEAALEAKDVTLMAIPTELVPKVRALLAGK